MERAHALHGHQPPANELEFKSTGSYRCGVSVAGASLDCQADLVVLNTEDPVFSCPSSQPPPREAPPAPHLSPSPQITSYTDGGDALFSVERLLLFVTEPRFQKLILGGVRQRREFAQINIGPL